MLKNLLFWGVLLIGLFLVLYFYVGSTNVLGAMGTTTTGIINALSGRDSQGNLPKAYPSTK